MVWIYLSPHLDDVALSCGGLVWEQAQAGDQPKIWTLCAGDPPPGRLSPFARELHQRWEVGRDSVQRRREEDANSCLRLGAERRYFSVPDCIYRRSPLDGRALYASEEAIFGPLDPLEVPLVEELSKKLEAYLPEIARIVCPLSVGSHVDHRLARAAAERLEIPLWYYADYPYAERAGEDKESQPPPGYTQCLFTISAEGMRAWFDSVAAHRSQISTFWANTILMERALEGYYQKHSGIPLWKPAQV